jgi:peptidoglycan-associated lipoprotein
MPVDHIVVLTLENKCSDRMLDSDAQGRLITARIGAFLSDRAPARGSYRGAAAQKGIAGRPWAIQGPRIEASSSDRRFCMKHWTLTCLLSVSLLTACSSSDDSKNASGSGGSTADVAGGGGSRRAAPGSQEDLTQSAGDRIFFDTDRSSVDQQASGTLDRQAAWLQQYPQVNIWVAGNCDERGTEEYNLALGQRRANADRDYLVAHGTQRSRVETISYGKSRPIDAASTPEAWAQNRNAITSVR